MWPTDDEPRPRDGATATTISSLAGRPLHALPTPRPLPDICFSDVLAARRSAVSGPLSDQELGDLLFHVMRWRRGGTEPRRVCRRLILVSYAAMGSVSRAA